MRDRGDARGRRRERIQRRRAVNAIRESPWRGMASATRALLSAALVAALTARALAQPALSEAQIVGTWTGTGHMIFRPEMTIRVEFKSDKTVEGATSAAGQGEMTYTNGHWRIEGDTLLVDYTAVGPRGKIDIGWALRQNGEGLSGRGTVKPVRLPFHVELGRAQ